MHFQMILVAGFSVSNAALLPVTSEGSDLLANLPLLSPPLSGALSLSPPTSGNTPSSPNRNLNAIIFDPLVDNTLKDPVSSSEIAQEPGVGDASIVIPFVTNAEKKTSTDDTSGTCDPETMNGQKRRKRGSYCRNPTMLEFHLRVPKKSEAGLPTPDQERDNIARIDNDWLMKEFSAKIGPHWREMDQTEVMNELVSVS